MKHSACQLELGGTGHWTPRSHLNCHMFQQPVEPRHLAITSAIDRNPLLGDNKHGWPSCLASFLILRPSGLWGLADKVRGRRPSRAALGRDHHTHRALLEASCPRNNATVSAARQWRHPPEDGCPRRHSLCPQSVVPLQRYGPTIVGLGCLRSPASTAGLTGSLAPPVILRQPPCRKLAVTAGPPKFRVRPPRGTWCVAAVVFHATWNPGICLGQLTLLHYPSQVTTPDAFSTTFTQHACSCLWTGRWPSLVG